MNPENGATEELSLEDLKASGRMEGIDQIEVWIDHGDEEPPFFKRVVEEVRVKSVAEVIVIAGISACGWSVTHGVAYVLALATGW